MATIFDSSSITPISTQNVTFFEAIESSTTERTQDSGALAACFFLAFTLGAISALLSKTISAPFERVKMIMQCIDSEVKMIAPEPRPSKIIIDVMDSIQARFDYLLLWVIIIYLLRAINFYD